MNEAICRREVGKTKGSGVAEGTRGEEDGPKTRKRSADSGRGKAKHEISDGCVAADGAWCRGVRASLALMRKDRHSLSLPCMGLDLKPAWCSTHMLYPESLVFGFVYLFETVFCYIALAGLDSFYSPGWS